MHDVVVIGGGLVGLASAYQIQRHYPDRSILIIEKEEKVAYHQSGRNSGVIHSGIYYTPGSLKATNCIRGYQMLLDFCDEHQIPYDICGKLIVATDDAEVARLHHIMERGEANGLSGLEIIDQAAISTIEPHVKGVKAIRVPQTGIIDFNNVAEKLASILRQNGAEIVFGEKVENIDKNDAGCTIITDRSHHQAKYLITAAGLYADQLAKMTTDELDIQIIPFRGEYYSLKEPYKDLVKHLIYPVPIPEFPFLGVHFTRRMDGSIEAGPNAVLAFQREGYQLNNVNWQESMAVLKYRGFRKLALAHWRYGLAEMRRSFSKKHFCSALQKLVPEIQPYMLDSKRAGVRAQSVDLAGHLTEDFNLIADDQCLHILNAPSPAATACFAIGEYICSLYNM